MLSAMGALSRAAQALGILTRADDTPPAGVTPPARSASPADPLSLDAIYRAVQILQTAGEQLTLDVRRGGQPLDNPPSWVASPDPWRPGSVFHAETIASLALRGNAYWRVSRDPAGAVVGLEVIDPLEVTITVPSYGPPQFGWSGRSYGPRDIAHLALMRMPGRAHPYGLGPIQACRESVDGAVKLRRWADEWLDSGTVPNGQLTSDQTLNGQTAKDLKTRFLDSVKANEPVVLGSGTNYKPFLLTPQEMQWLDSQNFNVVAIARLMGIPPRLMLAVLDGTSQTYANQAQEDLAFVRWTLMAYLREIEAAITWLLPRGQEARFNLDAVLRADTLTRYQAHQIGITAGFLDPAEVRSIEGLPPKATTTQPQEDRTNA